jgi:hypothetical protein
MHPEHQGSRIKSRRIEETKHNQTFLQKVFQLMSEVRVLGKNPRHQGFGALEGIKK